MSRSFDAQSIIVLPRLDAASAVALGTALGAAARGQHLAKPVHAALEALLHKTEALEQVISSTHAAPPAAADRVQADLAEDAAFGALFDWLNGWARLPGAPEAEQARSVLTAFPDGLAFTQLKYPLEWADADALLKKLDSDHAGAIAALGGQRMLDVLRRTHAAYGKALGVTKAAAPPPAPINLRAPLDACTATIRRYVLKVAGQVDEADSATVALRDALLAPLSNWTSAPTGGANAAPHGAQSPVATSQVVAAPAAPAASPASPPGTGPASGGGA